MGRKMFRILLAIAGAAGTIWLSEASAQEPLPLFLAFDFGHVKPLKQNPKAGKTAQAVAESVVECFKRRAHQKFFPWNFKTGGGSDYPKIKLILVEDAALTRWELRIEAYDENGGLADRVLQRCVSLPGDLELRRRTPRSDEFPGKVTDWLESYFLQPESRQGLQRLMMSVAPLGDCHILARNGIPKQVVEAEGVLELDWGRFQHLSGSVFTVICADNNRARVELGSEGEERPCEFNVQGRQGLGIALRHKTWNKREILDYLPKLNQLTTGRVYLEEFKGLRGLPARFGMRATDQ
jgi:hypothetical protein